MFEIIRTREESDRNINFVALGNLINQEQSYHAAFVIRHENNLLEFHYTGEKIELVNLRRDYYHKITDTIHPDEVASFIAKCINIRKNAKPEYGYFYSGESYDEHGNHQSDNSLGERMTCVGFCLNVLKGFLENEDYLSYEDWDSTTHEEEGYLEWYCETYNLNIEDVKSSHRRITPREFLTSGFFITIPIRKHQIDSKIQEVNEHFEARLRPSNS